jgi:hypothetical protein
MARNWSIEGVGPIPEDRVTCGSCILWRLRTHRLARLRQLIDSAVDEGPRKLQVPFDVCEIRHETN